MDNNISNRKYPPPWMLSDVQSFIDASCSKLGIKRQKFEDKLLHCVVVNESIGLPFEEVLSFFGVKELAIRLSNYIVNNAVKNEKIDYILTIALDELIKRMPE